MRPASVVLVGQRFAIEGVPEHDPRLRDGDAIGVGRAVVSKQRLLVEVDQGADQERDTVVHEVLHAIFAVVGAFDRARDEERVVSTLAPLLLDALRRNPGLVAYLQEESDAVP